MVDDEGRAGELLLWIDDVWIGLLWDARVVGLHGGGVMEEAVTKGDIFDAEVPFGVLVVEARGASFPGCHCQLCLLGYGCDERCILYFLS